MSCLGIIKSCCLNAINPNFETFIGVVILILFVIAQIVLFVKSYRQCAEGKGSTFWYCIIFVLLDILNAFVVLLDKSKFWENITGNNIDVVMPIITTILISFFGLTAASYTFQINDMHEQQRRFPNDSSFIGIYLERTRFKFSVALWSTVLICVLSVTTFIFEGFLCKKNLTGFYKIESGYILCVFATELILWMLYLNWVLFFHERYIDKYTTEVLKSFADKSNEEEKIPELLTRVNSLEMIFQRIVKNNIHVQDVYPLENQDVLAMLGSDGLDSVGIAEKRKNAELLVKKYYELISWRNAVIHLQNSRNRNLRKKLIPGSQLKKSLKELEEHIRKKRMTNERFTNMDLSSLDFLRESNLEKCDFSNCDLRNINLEGSDCIGANFSDSLLGRIYMGSHPSEKGIKIDRNTDLSQVNFYNCNLENTTIQYDGNEDKYFSMKEDNFDHVILSKSEMQKVDFKFASFDKAQLYYNNWKSCRANLAIFSESMFSNSLLQNTDFKRANFSGAVLVEADIKDCCFEEARLNKTDFSNSNIGGGNWNKVMATDASFKGARVSRVLPGGDLPIVKYKDPLFCQAVLRNVDFTESILSYVDMRDSQMSECIFTGSSGNENCFYNADMKNCLFNRTNWDCCVFDFTQFDCSVFKNVKFSNSSFVGTSFEQCLFLNTDNDSLNESRSLRDWRRELLMADKRIPARSVESHSETFLFQNAYLEKVSFAGAYGLSEQMFNDATIVQIDFRGTGISKRILHKYVRKMVGCRF